MAQVDNKGRKIKKPTPRYNNPNPMANVRDMGREGIRLIRDIAKGKFNFYTDGDIFRNLNFVNATIKAAEDTLFEAQVHANAMSYAYGGTNDNRVKQLITRDLRKVEAWVMIVDTLYKVKNTGDTRYLSILTYNLPNYRYNM